MYRKSAQGIALIRRQSLTFNPPYQTLAPLLYAAPFPIPESLRRPIYGIGDGSMRRRCCARSGGRMTRPPGPIRPLANFAKAGMLTPMPTRNISLTPEQDAFVEKVVA